MTTEMDEKVRYAHECAIRDLYKSKLTELRSGERVLRGEHQIPNSLNRADMLTVDENDLLRIWEFKIDADYSGLGQLLVYLAYKRSSIDFVRPVRGVLAAFSFPEEIRRAVEIMNL